MANPTVPKVRILIPQNTSQNTPPSPTKIDTEIAHRNGSTVAIDATKERMQASKTASTPSQSEIIYELTRTGGRLRRELDYERRLTKESEKFEEGVRYAFERLRIAIIDLRQSQKDIQREYDSF